ncbi:hypothetical protein M3Y98_00861000 [Aphelenchoides besseyi]|nr:hypothetical protein M3Y98_00861000 [Aphelenchoides besseyi]KAI6211180.1 hypothetical protein M3Y96_00406500 [Aphelenchoides besseyi]
MAKISSSATSLGLSEPVVKPKVNVTSEQRKALSQLLPKLISSDKTVVEATFATLKANQELKLDEEVLDRVIIWIKNRTKDGKLSSEMIDNFLRETECENANEISSLTITPPSYALDDEKKITSWPKRPAFGAHSEKNYYDRRIHRTVCSENRIRRQFLQATKTKKMQFHLPNDLEIVHFNGYFYGVLHPKTINYVLKARELAVFWPGFDPTKEILTRCRLLLAYKTSRGILHYLPLNKMVDGRWSISDFGFKTPLFESLKVLVSYLRDAKFVQPNKETSEYEHMPVWELDEKTLDIRQMADV